MSEEQTEYRGLSQPSDRSVVPMPGGDLSTRVYFMIEEIYNKIHELEMLIPNPPARPDSLIAKLGTGGTWTEQVVINGTITLAGTSSGDARTNLLASDPSAIITLPAGHVLLLEVVDGPDHRYVQFPTGFFPVLVKADGGGSNGPPCTLTYNVYDPSDTGFATPLASGVQPLCSRARINAVYIFAAPDGSDASAKYGTDGSVQLFDCQESQNDAECDDEEE